MGLLSLQSSSTTEQGAQRLGPAISCDGQRRPGLKDVSEKSRRGLHLSLEPSGASLPSSRALPPPGQRREKKNTLLRNIASLGLTFWVSTPATWDQTPLIG